MNLKHAIIALAAAISALAGADIVTRDYSYAQNFTNIGSWGIVKTVQITSSTNSPTLNVSLVQRSIVDGTIATNAIPVFSGTAPAAFTNITLSTPVYVKSIDTCLLSGLSATNGTAKVTFFIER